MEWPTDKLREKIAKGETIFGTHTSWGGAMITEIYGVAGFDVVWVDTEHGNMDPKEVQNALIGARAGGVPAFVRVPWHTGVLAKPLLDIGADGIIFPMVLTAADAKEAVDACRYPPEGVRGYGPFRAMRYGAVDAMEYINDYSRKVWVITQIEHIEAVRNLEAILKVPGIDLLVVGPCDLSGSMGLLGQINHPGVKSALDEIAAKTKAAGIPLGVSMVWNEEAAIDWARRGANFIFCDNEGGYIVNGCRKTLAKLRQIAGR
ncbi:MAG: 4-hydroxy-3-methylbut-2-en-1-yl diphosphate synthase [Planctomycetota bacterium]|jgi:2-dehydro-3-deoxyglucarate aldolase/4-hydroxy-2-oxoheptanedioate aldolase|nr:4-hydroxy-3-methylbut-2-en-1-yl diphosphate synthase [Planctomycetota bacterium]